jgi:hypothetical protein
VQGIEIDLLIKSVLNHRGRKKIKIKKKIKKGEGGFLFDPYFRANKSHPCSLTLIYNLIIFNSILRKEKSLDFTPSIYNSSVTSHLNVIDQIKKIKKKKKPLPTMLYIYIVMLYEFFFLIDWCT